MFWACPDPAQTKKSNLTRRSIALRVPFQVEFLDVGIPLKTVDSCGHKKKSILSNFK
jgi:hypothetical protein